MTKHLDDGFYNLVGGERIQSRQIDELIGLARGLLADGKVVQAEVEFLQKWLAANVAISSQPLVKTLYRRVDEILSDGIVDDDEKTELFETLNQLATRDFELGETLKATSLPLDNPQPELAFDQRRYCFTGTFTFGHRRNCEQAVIDRGGSAGSLTQRRMFS